MFDTHPAHHEYDDDAAQEFLNAWAGELSVNVVPVVDAASGLLPAAGFGLCFASGEATGFAMSCALTKTHKALLDKATTASENA